MFRSSKAAPAPAKSPARKPGKQLNDASSLAGCGSNNNNARPVLGRVTPSHLLVGAKVWVADARVLWRIGDVQRIDTDQQTADVFVPDAPDEKLQTLSLSKLFTFDATHVVDHDDVAAMNNLHEAPLLNVLRQRFERDQIYTFTADILLSINPYKSIPLLYDVLGFMDAQARRDVAGDSTIQQPPHLFTIAARAYAGMKGVLAGAGTPQSIVISGESGAGKTEASKYIMKYLATASKHASGTLANGTSASAAATTTTHVHERIEECVVLSNLILESFGNAKTSRNDNSSRFGKYIQIHYNSDGRMVGVSIRHFLLEKTRLVLPQASERNYHIFYQLLAGLPSLGSTHEQALRLSRDVWNYTYLTHGDCVDVDGVDDAIEFEQLRSCLSQLGMDATAFQLPMFAILAAILHLGNVQFETIEPQADGTAAASDSVASVAIFPESDRGVDLAHVAALLGVAPLEFAAKMVTQTTVTGRGSILELQLTPSQAKNALDAFCKHLYGELFHYLIARINASAKEHTDAAASEVSTDQTKPKPKPKASSPPAPPAFIGILDIFGFEVMATNSLEQLCINFTNETLQQQFNRHVFVLEQERYAREGIVVEAIEFQDNQPCLELIQKPPTGLLPLLEEQMLLKRKTTDKQLLTIYHGQHLDKHASYSKPRFECDEFVIRHYAGDVVYAINGFIAKNTDNLHDDLLDLLRRSSQPLVHAIFASVSNSNNSDSKTAGAAAQKRGAAAPTATNKPSGKAGGAALTGTTTVSSRFRLQLAELMDVLWQTTPNYVKCLKPNNVKFPGGFSCELVRDQLTYSGVLEVVRIRQHGFPIRKRFDVFYELFWPLAVASSSRPTAGADATVATTRLSTKTIRIDPQQLRKACEQIATAWLSEPLATTTTKQTFAMGRDELFLRYGQVEKLEAYVAGLRNDKAVVIQSKFGRARVAFRHYQRVLHGMRRLQAQWRMYATRNRFSALRVAAVVVQAKVRGHRLRERFVALKRAATTVFRATMRFLTRRRFAMWQTRRLAAIAIQCHVRGFLSRTAAERTRKLRDRSVLILQSWRRMSVHRIAFIQQRRAAVRLQSAYRCKTHRRVFLQHKAASVVLAAFARQVLQRRRFTLLKRRVVKLQARVRQWRQRRQYKQLRRLALYIQSKQRQRTAQQCASTRRAAVVSLQHALRGWSCRCQYLTAQRAIAKLQYWAASWLLQREYRRAKAAARCLQRAWRRYRRVAYWQREVASLFASPFAVAGTSCTQHSRMEESARRIARLRQRPSLFFRLRPQAFGYNSLFHHAAASGDMDVVQFMLAQREAIAMPCELLRMLNGRGNTALHEAARHGQYAMVKFLLVQLSAVLEPVAVSKDGNEQSDTRASDSSSSNISSVAVPAASSSNQSHDTSDKQPDNATVPPALNAKTTSGPETDALLPPGVVFSGYLRKRRETSRWMKRFVVLRVTDAHVPTLQYFASSAAAAAGSHNANATVRSSIPLDLRAAVLKKSVDTAFAFELHSPQLLVGRNREGRLYFAAASELESQQWLAHLRDAVPSSLELRLFAMHRSAATGALECVDFVARARASNLRNCSKRRETPLHLAARVVFTTATATATDALSTNSGLVSNSVSGVGSVPRQSWTTPGGRATVLSPKATAFEPAASSSISVTTDDDESSSSGNQQSSSEISGATDDAATATALLGGKSKLEVEADIVRTVLWLVECGAEINAVTARNETALQLALRANNLLVAKHLLDRGALAISLSQTELEVAQRLKATLAKTAISSVGCSRSTGSSSMNNSSSTVAALASRLGSFRKRTTVTSSSSTTDDEDAPPLFLLKQPGRVRNSSYVSVFLEHIGISTPQFLSRPRVLISVLDAQRHVVERRQLVAVQPVVLPTALLWAITWHMQTPLENLPHGACVVFELTISPTVSSAGAAITAAAGATGASGLIAPSAPSSATSTSSSSSALSSAADFVPVCWTYIQVDQRTANCMPLNAEMYKYPLDLSLKKLQRVDAFISGDVLVSQGPSQ